MYFTSRLNIGKSKFIIVLNQKYADKMIAGFLNKKRIYGFKIKHL